MTRTVSLPPSTSVMGTMLWPCARSVSASTGCCAFLSSSEASRVNSGSVQSNSRAKRARANTESSSAIVSTAKRSGPRLARRRRVISSRIRPISAASSSVSCTSLLLCSIVSKGSTNTVCPVALCSVNNALHLTALGSADGDDKAVVAQRDVVSRRHPRRAYGEIRSNDL